METNKSKFVGYMLFAVFLVPLLIAIAMYAMRGDSSQIKTVAHGELVHPAQPIEVLTVKVNSDESYDLSNLQGKWTYILYLDDACNLQCEAALFKIRQTRLATGREATRVQSFMVMGSSRAEIVDEVILQRNPKIIFGQLEELTITDDVASKENLQPNLIYLIDPNGNLMMKYDDMATSKGMLKDIKKLLKLSNIG
ncbi:MAG: hypothetical protein AAGB35_06065 [Pseudomonadota bacterium]